MKTLLATLTCTSIDNETGKPIYVSQSEIRGEDESPYTIEINLETPDGKERNVYIYVNDDIFVKTDKVAK